MNRIRNFGNVINIITYIKEIKMKKIKNFLVFKKTRVLIIFCIMVLGATVLFAAGYVVETDGINNTIYTDDSGNAAVTGSLNINGIADIYNTINEGGTIRLRGNNGLFMHIENINGTLRLVNNEWTIGIFNVDQSGNMSINGQANINNGISIYNIPNEGGTIKLLGSEGTHMHLENLRGTFRLVNSNWTAGIFHVDQIGNVNASGTVTAQSYACSSDLRYKNNITPIGNALQKLMSLNGIFYNWKTENFKEKSFSKERQLGFIAQDVEKVFPELVFTDSKGYKSMSYDKLTAVIVEAMKEMKQESDAKISSLEKENEFLKQRIASMEKVNERVVRLERMMGEVRVAGTTNMEKEDKITREVGMGWVD